MSYIMKATLFFPTSGCSILSDEVRPNMFPPQQRHKKQTLPEKTENDTLNKLCRAAFFLGESTAVHRLRFELQPENVSSMFMVLFTVQSTF